MLRRLVSHQSQKASSWLVSQFSNTISQLVGRKTHYPCWNNFKLEIQSRLEIVETGASQIWLSV